MVAVDPIRISLVLFTFVVLYYYCNGLDLHSSCSCVYSLCTLSQKVCQFWWSVFPRDVDNISVQYQKTSKDYADVLFDVSVHVILTQHERFNIAMISSERAMRYTFQLYLIFSSLAATFVSKFCHKLPGIKSILFIHSFNQNCRLSCWKEPLFANSEWRIGCIITIAACILGAD